MTSVHYGFGIGSMNNGINVIIVGAGIAGLTAAIALRRSGHNVRIFEKSQFIGEVGAAFALSPNGVKVLRTLGFSPEGARARPIQVWDVFDAVDLRLLNKMDLSDAEQVFGAPVLSVHRVDMHNELLRIAKQPHGQSPGVQIHLSSKVAGGNALEGYIDLEDGTRHYADLVVAADGVRSVLRPLVTEKETKSIPTGFGAFRFLIPSQKFLDDPHLAKLLDQKSPGSTLFTDSRDKIPERHMVWYACREYDNSAFPESWERMALTAIVERCKILSVFIRQLPFRWQRTERKVRNPVPEKVDRDPNSGQTPQITNGQCLSSSKLTTTISST
nr:fad-dependent monooxygenase ops4 [Quercus suber]